MAVRTPTISVGPPLEKRSAPLFQIMNIVRVDAGQTIGIRLGGIKDALLHDVAGDIGTGAAVVLHLEGVDKVAMLNLGTGHKVPVRHFIEDVLWDLMVQWDLVTDAGSLFGRELVLETVNVKKVSVFGKVIGTTSLDRTRISALAGTLAVHMRNKALQA